MHVRRVARLSILERFKSGAETNSRLGCLIHDAYSTINIIQSGSDKGVGFRITLGFAFAIANPAADATQHGFASAHNAFLR